MIGVFEAIASTTACSTHTGMQGTALLLLGRTSFPSVSKLINLFTVRIVCHAFAVDNSVFDM